MNEARDLHCVGCSCIQRHSFDHAFVDRLGAVLWYRCDVCAMPRSLDVHHGADDVDLVGDAYDEYYVDLGVAG